MHTPLLLGLDLGTTNAKAALYDLAGNLVGEKLVSYPTSYPQPGWAEQRIQDWTAALTYACRQLMAALAPHQRRLVGIGLSAHGPGLVFVDATGRPLLETSPTWQDTRCLAHGQRLLDSVGPHWTGLGIPANSFPPKLFWAVERHPEIASRARYALGIKDYLVHWLTGVFATEPSNVAGSERWWPPVFAACSWSVERLAPVVSSTAVVGQVRAALVHELGLPTALPVVSGIADGASATLSMGAIEVHDTVLTLATSGVIRVVLPEAAPAAQRLAHNLFCWPYIPDRWIVGGHLKSAASALQWFTELKANPSLSPTDGFASMLDAAAASPVGSRGVCFLPYLLGRGSPHANENAKGAFLGLTLAHTRGDLARAILEGVAFTYREVLDDFQQMGYNCAQIRMSGGGARSTLWRQILASVLERPLTYYAADSTLGAAIMAAVGVGCYADFQAATASMVHAETTTIPQPDQTSHYAELFQQYQMLRDRLYPTQTENA